MSEYWKKGTEAMWKASMEDMYEIKKSEEWEEAFSKYVRSKRQAKQFIFARGNDIIEYTREYKKDGKYSSTTIYTAEKRDDLFLPETMIYKDLRRKAKFVFDYLDVIGWTVAILDDEEYWKKVKEEGKKNV